MSLKNLNFLLFFYEINLMSQASLIYAPSNKNEHNLVSMNHKYVY